MATILSINEVKHEERNKRTKPETPEECGEDDSTSQVGPPLVCRDCPLRMVLGGEISHPVCITFGRFKQEHQGLHVAVLRALAR